MKKFLLMSTTLMILCICSTVFAGTLVKKVYFSSFPIVINGEEYSSETPILNYQNMTYVALREFAEMVEVDVSFKEDTIIIKSREELIDDKIALKNDETKEKIEVIVETLPKENEEDRIVYVSKTGVKYHIVSNCNGGNYSSIKWSEAKNKGYTSCLRCAANLV